MKIYNEQDPAPDIATAMERLTNLIDQAVKLRQCIPIVIRIPSGLNGAYVVIEATVGTFPLPHNYHVGE